MVKKYHSTYKIPQGFTTFSAETVAADFKIITARVQQGEGISKSDYAQHKNTAFTTEYQHQLFAMAYLQHSEGAKITFADFMAYITFPNSPSEKTSIIHNNIRLLISPDENERAVVSKNFRKDIFDHAALDQQQQFFSAIIAGLETGDEYRNFVLFVLRDKERREAFYQCYKPQDLLEGKNLGLTKEQAQQLRIAFVEALTSDDKDLRQFVTRAGRTNINYTPTVIATIFANSQTAEQTADILLFFKRDNLRRQKLINSDLLRKVWLEDGENVTENAALAKLRPVTKEFSDSLIQHMENNTNNKFWRMNGWVELFSKNYNDFALEQQFNKFADRHQRLSQSNQLATLSLWATFKNFLFKLWNAPYRKAVNKQGHQTYMEASHLKHAQRALITPTTLLDTNTRSLLANNITNYIRIAELTSADKVLSKIFTTNPDYHLAISIFSAADNSKYVASLKKRLEDSKNYRPLELAFAVYLAATAPNSPTVQLSLLQLNAPQLKNNTTFNEILNQKMDDEESPMVTQASSPVPKNSSLSSIDSAHNAQHYTISPTTPLPTVTRPLPLAAGFDDILAEVDGQSFAHLISQSSRGSPVFHTPPSTPKDLLEDPQTSPAKDKIVGATRYRTPTNKPNS